MMLKKTIRTNVPVFPLYFILGVLTAIMVFSVIPYRNATTIAPQITNIDTVSASVDGGPWETVTLPHEFKELDPRTPVTIRTTIKPGYDDSIYIKTVYSPAKVWLNDKLIYTMSAKNTYPDFFLDPPTNIQLLKTNGMNENMQLKIKYLSPVSRDSLMVHNLKLGSSKDLMYDSGSHLAAPMILSLIQTLIGFLLIILSLFLILLYSNGYVFFWVGLFSKFSGVWFLCENNFSVLCYKNDSLLFVLSFLGFFSFIVPLIHFIRLLLDSKSSKLLIIMEIFSAIAVGVAILLQFTGIMSFTQSMYFFHIWIPIALAIITFIVTKNALIYHNQYARKLLLPTIILTISAYMELFNYQLHITYVFSSIFQIGMTIFLFFICIIASLDFKDSIQLKKKAELIEQEKQILNIQTEQQRSRSLLLAENEEKLREQRHDLRHHLTAIQQLSGDNKALQDYLSTLMEKIPTSAGYYCENTVVNSIISHYASKCNDLNITFTSKLVVPETQDHETDSNLCVIFANLLENATEACERIIEKENFITIRSTVKNNMLVISMENSYNGHFSIIDGRFRSSKRNDFGIGLSSIRSIAENANGSADFNTTDEKFISKVYMQLP